jgi:hypothetical protein
MSIVNRLRGIAPTPDKNPTVDAIAARRAAILPGNLSVFAHRLRAAAPNLPDNAIAKIADMISLTENFEDEFYGMARVVDGNRDELYKAQQEHANIEGKFKDYKRRETQNSEDVDRSISESAARVAAKSARVQKSNERLTSLVSRSSSVKTTLKTLLAYASQLSSPVASLPVLNSKIREIAPQIDAARAQIATLQNQLARVESAPLPSSEAKALMRSQIDIMAERGRPDVSRLIECGGDIRFAKIQALKFGLGDVSPSPAIVFDAEAFGAWLHRDAIVAALNAEIGKFSDDSEAIAAPDRAQKIAQLKAEILSAERDEERLIEAQSGPQEARILRRSDADPRAVLLLADNAPQLLQTSY